MHAEPELESSRTRSPARSYDSYEDNPGSGKADPIAVIQPKTKAYFSYLSTSPTYIRHFFGVPVTSKSWTRTAPAWNHTRKTGQWWNHHPSEDRKAYPGHTIKTKTNKRDGHAGLQHISFKVYSLLSPD